MELLCCYCWGVVQLQALGQCCKYNCAVSLPLQSFEVNAMFLTDEGCACLAADEVQEYVYIGSGSDLPKTVEIVVRHCCWRWLQSTLSPCPLARSGGWGDVEAFAEYVGMVC
jgi:hypothetical protein